MGGSARSSDSESSALCRYPGSLGHQDTDAECSLTEQWGAELGRSGFSEETGRGRKGELSSYHPSPQLPSRAPREASMLRESNKIDALLE